jgi:hypothetical protein
MTSRGPTTQSLDDRIDALSEDMKGLTKGLTDFRVEMTDKLGKFQGGVENDLRWIKRIGASVLLIAIGGAAWVIREVTTVKDDVRHQERRLDAIDSKLDTLLSRTAPKAG